MKKRPRQKPTSVAGAYLSEQRKATSYTRKWHAVHAWGLDIVQAMDELDAPQPANPRTTLLRGSLVYALWDEEEAYARGLDLMDLYVPFGPRMDEGGRRRVTIRVLTWIPDDYAGIAHDPAWITTGNGMSAFVASAKHARFTRNYADAVERGIESRRLLCTAVEVLFWTSGPYAETL